MKKHVVNLLVILFVLCVTMASAVESMGRFEGFRRTKGTEQLARLEAERFALLQAGKGDEAAELLEGKIKPLRREAKKYACWIETKAYTYTARNKLDVYLYFSPISPKEGKNGGADVFQFQFQTSLDEYEKIFEDPKELNRFPVDGFVFNTYVTTTVSGNRRTIKLYQENTVDAEITEVFKRQTCVLTVEDGLITSISVEKEKKRFLSFGGFQKTFSAQVIGLHKAQQGLLLVDEGDMGWLKKRSNIAKAISDKSSKNFTTLIKQEQNDD